MLSKIKAKYSAIPLTVKVSVAYAVCSIVQKCISFFTMPLFTRMLTKEQYGQYTVYQSWSGILSIFLTLNLAYGSFSSAMVKFEDKRTSYVSSIQGICLILSVAFLAIYLPLNELWNKLFELPTYVILVLVAEITAQTAVLLWNGKKRFELKYKSVICVTLLTSFFCPLMAYILITVTEEKGYARIIGYALVNIIIGGIIFFINTYKGKMLYNKAFWKYAFSFNIPLLAYYLSQMIFNQSDRIMISHICGIGDAALYGVAYNLSMLMTFVLNAINNSYIPWLYGKLKSENAEANKTISCGIAFLMALIILCIIWFAPEIIAIMAGKEYLEAVWVVAPVSISLLLLFYSQLFINIEFYYEEKRFLVIASIAAAIINIVLNFILIPIFGFTAAGYTTLFSYIIFAVSNYLAMKKILKKHTKKDNLYNYKGLLLILVLFVVAGFCGVILYDLLIIRIAVTLAVFIGLLVCLPKVVASFKELK